MAHPVIPVRDQAARDQLAPTGVLRAGINLGNPLLVTGRGPHGEPTGVAPDLAAAAAAALGLQVQYIPFPTPSAVAEAAGQDRWDIALIGAEPQRAERVDFTAAYAEIEATYLVPDGSPIRSIAEVDAPGVRVAVTGGAAYCLWLERNLRHATLVTADSLPGAVDVFTRDGLEALAGLRTALVADVGRFPGARVLEGRFATVQQAIGTAKGNRAGSAFLDRFVEDAKASGLVSELITRHGATGLVVATHTSME
ncbi:MAG: amino acid transporter substrate-binding protein [Pseudonocardiales bacterium]|nr:amino acid transporter substrate-binding protein [Pseudonocardiales bacterium]